MNLKKIGKVFTSKFLGTGPSSLKKKIYRAAVSQRLRNIALEETFHVVRATSAKFGLSAGHPEVNIWDEE
jgi:hypothetical protein